MQTIQFTMLGGIFFLHLLNIFENKSEKCILLLSCAIIFCYSLNSLLEFDSNSNNNLEVLKVGGKMAAWRYQK